MEARNYSEASQELVLNGSGLSIPLGGPIYATNLVGPLTRVPHFESSLVQELQSLETELHSDLSQPFNEDISVDELKVFTEEQLLNMALEEAFLSGKNADNLPQLPEENLDAGILRENGVRANEEEASAATLLQIAPASNANRSRNKIVIRKRKMENNPDVERRSIAKAAEIAKIKQKQDQERAAVELNSFKWKNEAVNSSSEGKGRMKSLRSTNSYAKVPQMNSLSNTKHEAVRHQATVLFVEVYHNARKMKTQELLVLGQQTLTELKDKIYCFTDKLMAKAGQQDSSGYFLIEDLFCNDLRDPSAIDYSKPIFDWLRNSRDEATKKWECITTGELQQKQKAVMGEVAFSQVPHFRSVSMNKIRFCDLGFRLGAGYLYCHQGNCKHTIVIRDMRLIHPEDVHDRAAYPIVTFQLKTRVQKCNVCKIYRAKKVTLDDKWAQDNPCYFCQDCYFLLHYSKEGSLLYNDFVVYDYLHD